MNPKDLEKLNKMRKVMVENEKPVITYAPKSN